MARHSPGGAGAAGSIRQRPPWPLPPSASTSSRRKSCPGAVDHDSRLRQTRRTKEGTPMIWIHQNPWRVEADTWTDEGVKHLSVEVGSLSEAITIEENWLADTLPL